MRTVRGMNTISPQLPRGSSDGRMRNAQTYGVPRQLAVANPFRAHQEFLIPALQIVSIGGPSFSFKIGTYSFTRAIGVVNRIIMGPRRILPPGFCHHQRRASLLVWPGIAINPHATGFS